MNGQQEVIDFLCGPQGSERIETHGSLIVLRGERAYKLKRAVAYASLDFRSLESRARACRDGGATRLFAAAAHGLFTGGTALLDSPLFERIVLCDTVPPFRLPAELAARRLTPLDSTALVAAQLAENYGLDR